jgi:cytochrome c oxidase assembly protein subunit 15
MVFAMVVIGGVTRLTQSGLSIVEWQPILGTLPPIGDAAWEAAFAEYQKFPEYQKVNQGMTLDAFKSIFWVEYIHRLWGRLIGLVFAAPLVLFWIRGRLPRALRWPLVGIFALGGLQGALGWYMVKSGLIDRPDVSPYRLTAHLLLAVAIYGAVLWIAFGLVAPRGRGGPSRRLGRWLLALVVLTIAAGGFVAGLDAGFAFNTFPLMDGKLVPDDYAALSPAWQNVFENISAVQFNHRWLAIATLVLAAAFWRSLSGQAPAVRLAGQLVLAAAGLQVTLGIATLLLIVPVPLAAAHQAGALVLFTAVLWANHRLRVT